MMTEQVKKQLDRVLVGIKIVGNIENQATTPAGLSVWHTMTIIDEAEALVDDLKKLKKMLADEVIHEARKINEEIERLKNEHDGKIAG